MKRNLAVLAFSVMAVFADPPAASDVVWVTREVEEAKPVSSKSFVIYTVPKDRGFLLREIDGGGCVVTVTRVSLNRREVVAERVGGGSVWKSDVGIPFGSGDEVEVRTPAMGQKMRISGVLTRP